MNKAVYPGSFDPVTYGHIDIVKRASKIFDVVIVCIMVNVKKKYMFTLEERKAFLEKAFADIPNVKVDVHEGLLADYAEKEGCTAIIKGLRNATDFEYETNMEFFNRRFAPQIETIYLKSTPEYEHISSSTIKELVNFGMDISSFVPEYIEKVIKNRCLSLRSEND